MMSELFEEHFAPDPDSEEYKKQCSPRKRFVKLSSNQDAGLLLKIENIKQIKETLEHEASSDDESTSNRYLKLELANKELEINDLTTKLATFETIIDSMNRYDETMNVIKNNINIYDSMIKEVNTVSYHELVKKEIKDIKSYELPTKNNLPVNVLNAFETMYSNLSATEKNKAKEFHTILFNKNRMTNITFYLETLFGSIILVLYMYYFLFL